jgi:hypothetical protein
MPPKKDQHKTSHEENEQKEIERRDNISEQSDSLNEFSQTFREQTSRLSERTQEIQIELVSSLARDEITEFSYTYNEFSLFNEGEANAELQTEVSQGLANVDNPRTIRDRLAAFWGLICPRRATNLLAARRKLANN